MDEIIKLASQCRIASPHDVVLNSECAYTFHSPFTTDQGILVNLNTFIGTTYELSLPKTSTNNDNDIPSKSIFIRIVKNRVEKQPTTPTSETLHTSMDDTKSNGITKLGVGVVGGFQSEQDKFEIQATYSIVLLSHPSDSTSPPTIVVELPYNETTKQDFPMQVSQSADSIIHHSGLAVQQDLSAWELDEEPIPVSKYYQTIPFVDNGISISPNPSDWKCQASGATDNLWLNLSDGYIGGGRKNWDGSGGSNGALDHYIEIGKQYPLVVKLGTITADTDAADCFSYSPDEDGPVKIPNLAELLEKRGIKVSGMQKTVKSTAELEVELNATYAFDAITEAGAHLIPVNGPGQQGLQNLGNSCYMNSVCQTLFSGTIHQLSKRYGPPTDNIQHIMDHPLFQTTLAKDAPTDILCQTAKLTHALTSGVFAGPLPDSATVIDSTSDSTNPKYRLAPRMFKHALAKNHIDFKTGQQQDAAHYLQYLLEMLDQAECNANPNAFSNNGDGEDDNIVPTSNLFAFKTTSRLVCSADNLVKYKDNTPETILSLRIPMEKATKSEPTTPDSKRLKSDSDEETKQEKKDDDVPSIHIKSCLDQWAANTTIDGLRWPHLGNAAHSATNQNRFGTFPPYLFIALQRYQIGADWVPRKLDVNVEVPDELDLNYLKNCGPLDGELLVPEEEEKDENTTNVIPQQPNINEAAVEQLSAMGFTVNGCKRALLAVGGSDVEAAMNWIFEHNMDPDFNDPLPETSSSAGSLSTTSDIDEGVVASLVESLGCFTSDQVRVALKESSGDAARAADWLFSHMDDLDSAIAALQLKSEAQTSQSNTASPPPQDGDGKYSLIGLISHIGKHTGSGHYVCHLKKNDRWVIFNDEKVALSESPPTQHAYIYLFKRKD